MSVEPIASTWVTGDASVSPSIEAVLVDDGLASNVTAIFDVGCPKVVRRRRSHVRREMPSNVHGLARDRLFASYCVLGVTPRSARFLAARVRSRINLRALRRLVRSRLLTSNAPIVVMWNKVRSS